MESERYTAVPPLFRPLRYAQSMNPSSILSSVFVCDLFRCVSMRIKEILAGASPGEFSLFVIFQYLTDGFMSCTFRENVETRVDCFRCFENLVL